MIVEDHPGTIDSLPERYMMNTQIAKANAIKMESVPNDMANFNGFLEKPKIPAEANENRKKILQKELSVLNTEEKIANGLLQFEVSENVRLSVMDKIQNYYAPKLKAYYATL